MWDRLKLVTPPASDPVTLADAKTRLGISGADQDAALTVALKAAIAAVEGPYGIGVALLSQQWRLSLDCFPRRITVPIGPVVSVDSVTYLTEAGVQTLAPSGYVYDLDADPVRIVPAWGKFWPPVILYTPGSVKVTFTAGYASAAAVPAPLRDAIVLLSKQLLSAGAAEAFLSRETVDGMGTQEWARTDAVAKTIQGTIDALLAPYRRGTVA